MSNLRDRVQKQPTLPTVDMEVEEWGETVRLRGLTAAQVARIADAADEGGEDAESGLEWTVRQLLIPCVLDPETDEPAFGDEDADWLKGQPIAVVQRLAAKVQELSGMGPLDEVKKD